ncbi:MAG: S41 family peptidase [Acidobacteriota bacterium]|nr:S41 family peptidase [Acidobacteriota bacterium]
MKRTRIVFLSASIGAVLLFAGVLMANRSNQDVLFRALGNLAEVVHLVETEYVDELNHEALSMSLDAGLVEPLDRSAAVLPSDRINEYLEFVGSPPAFGLGLATRLGSASVYFVLQGSPAETAGLARWEVIELVEGVNSRGRPLWQIRLDLMERERLGETVRLAVFDREVDERREVILEPAQWTVRPATVEVLNEATVIRIEALPENGVSSVVELVPAVGPLVLDLRELRWGTEDAAIALADAFVEAGVLGGWQGRRAGSKTFAATQGSIVASAPVVLVDHTTQGIAEILAEALQRNGAVVVGEKTVGHASYMSLVRDGDVAVWMPVGQWLRADDEPINGNGVEPDELVEVADPDADEDPVLARALEVLSRALPEAA